VIYPNRSFKLYVAVARYLRKRFVDFIFGDINHIHLKVLEIHAREVCKILWSALQHKFVKNYD